MSFPAFDAAPASPTPSFGFTKDTESIRRRPSFSDSLDNVLNAKITAATTDLAAVLKQKAAGYLLKKSSAGRFNKRYFVVHGHYLSYFRVDPKDIGASKVPLGILDLWHVEGVSIDENVLALHLSAHATQARHEEMGGDAAKMLSTAPLAKNVFRRVEHSRRSAENKFVLKAPDAKSAQIWLTIMRETPLMGSLASLHAALEEEGELVVKTLRVNMPPAREFIFADAGSLLSGSTDILLRNVPVRKSTLSVTLSGGKKGEGEYTGTAPFEPAIRDSGGEVVISTPFQHEVRIKWQRRYSTYQKSVVRILALFFGIFLFGIIITGSFRGSLLLAVLCASGGGLFFIREEQETNNVVISSVNVVKDGYSTLTTSPRGGKKRADTVDKTAAPKYVPTDPHITKAEAQLIVELRERVRDMWQPRPDSDVFIKKYEKLFREWHVDPNLVKDPAKLKEVMDKHILADHRLVRFIRARKGKIDKAEHMIRDALNWRVALNMDNMLKDPEITPPPDWVTRYFGPKHIMDFIRPYEDSETRIREFFIRDKEGHLALFFRAGRLNTRKIFRKLCSKPTYMVKLVVWTAEMLRHDLELHREITPGKPETLISVIIDLDGFALTEHVPLDSLLSIARRFFTIFATAYPELLNRVLVFNAPWLFGTLWSAIQPFIPEEVQEKIQIHSGAVNYDKHIRPYFDDEYIPKYFGGKLVDKEDGNEFCIDRVAPFGPYGLPDEGAELLVGQDELGKTW